MRACSSLPPTAGARHSRPREIIIINDDDDDEDEVVVRRDRPGEGDSGRGGCGGDGARGKVAPGAAATARTTTARLASAAAAREVSGRRSNGGAWKTRDKVGVRDLGRDARDRDGNEEKVASCSAQGRMPRPPAGEVVGRYDNGGAGEWEWVEVRDARCGDKAVSCSEQGRTRPKPEPEPAPVGEVSARHDNVGAGACDSCQEGRGGDEKTAKVTRYKSAGKRKGLAVEESSDGAEQEEEEELRWTRLRTGRQKKMEISDTEEEEETELSSSEEPSDASGEASSRDGNGSGRVMPNQAVGDADKNRKDASCDAAPVNQRGAFVAARTRTQFGKQRRVEYTTYFQQETCSDTEEEEEEDKDDDEDGNGEEEEEAEEEEEEESCHTPSNVTIEISKNSAGEDGSQSRQKEVESSQIFLKRKFSGIDILVPVGSPKGSGTNAFGIARRTRSHFSSGSNKKKKQKLGTFTKPFCIDVSESGSESEQERESELPSHSEQRGIDDSGSDGIAECSNKREGRWQHKRSNPRSSNAWRPNKRKCGRRPKGQALLDLLINTICNEKENLSDDFVPPNEEASPPAQNQFHGRNVPPLVFSFGDEDDDEEEHGEFLDELWTDFDFATESINIGVHHCNEEGQQRTEQDTCPNPAALCSEGKHHLILDEQVGIRCKYCSFVDLEIRHILPSLGRLFRGREARRRPEMGSLYDDLLAPDELEGAEGSGGGKTGTVWDLIPGVRETMYAHQQEAFEFMWRNLAGGIVIDELKSTAKTDVVGGCVISHAPGTGKTRLAIAFVQAYLKVFPRCRPVIIAPKGVLATWEGEFRKWNAELPFQVLNFRKFSWIEDRTIRELATKQPLNKETRRQLKLISWHRGSSILGVSYRLFKQLASDNSAGGQEVRKMLLEMPGLLVLDEGHIPRNDSSLIWKVLAQVKTENSIILSGTPFQNNFDELYSILCLVRPKFAEKIAAETDGKNFWTSLTSRVTDDNVDEVRSVLKPFVHVHNGDILHSLPGLRESVVILNPPPHQKDIIAKMEKVGHLEAEHKISLASVHPSLIACAKLSDEEASLVDKSFLETLRSNPYEGVKTRFVIEFVRLCDALAEKVLVFSQFLAPLRMIKEQLIDQFSWTDGKEVLQMDGRMKVRRRQALIEAFNDMQSEAKVMLASTKACSEGIRLTGASRVVLLDVVWNPAVGKQAIGRAYRIGQEKIVYTYNLIAAGTKEKEKYDRQVRKDHLSKLLFSPESSSLKQHQSSKLISDDKVLEEMMGHDQLKDMFVKIYGPHPQSG